MRQDRSPSPLRWAANSQRQQQLINFPTLRKSPLRLISPPHQWLNMILAGWGSSATNSTQLYLPRLSASFQRGSELNPKFGFSSDISDGLAAKLPAPIFIQMLSLGVNMWDHLLDHLVGDVIPAVPYIKQTTSSPTMHMANKRTPVYATQDAC